MTIDTDTTGQNGAAGGREMRRTILEYREAIAERGVELCWQNDPDLERRYGREGRKKCRQDILYHIDYLAEALGVASPSLFNDYVDWSALLLEQYGIGEEDLVGSLELLLEASGAVLDREVVAVMREYVEQAIRTLREGPRREAGESHLGRSTGGGSLARLYLETLLKGERREAIELILGAVATGLPIREVYLEVFAPVQHEIGRLWQIGELSVAEEHFCTAVTQSIMAQLYPQFIARTRSTKGKVVALSVSGELHELGIRMISDLLELEGWDTYYIGANTPEEELCPALIAQGGNLIAISATMTWHVDRVRRAIEAIRERPECAATPILVGGYPFNVASDLWKEIGADGYAATAAEVVNLVERLCGKGI